MLQKFIRITFMWAFSSFAVSIACAAQIDGLWVSSFGDSAKQAIVFIHGGPGYNAKDFEVTTAEKLAALGYFVVTYDQRGQGRSDATSPEKYNYTQYADDLLTIINKLQLKNPILLASSHGGPIAINFETRHPKVAGAIILQSSPINFWSLMEDLYHNCAARYRTSHQDKALLDLTQSFDLLAKHRKGSKELIAPVQNFDNHSISGCKLFQTSHPSPDELRLRKIIEQNPSPMEQNSMPGFLLNESYIYRDYSVQVKGAKGKYFAIYGSEDGLFTASTLKSVESLLGKSHFYLIGGASHGVYLDQQQKFLTIVDGIAASLVRP